MPRLRVRWTKTDHDEPEPGEAVVRLEADRGDDRRLIVRHERYPGAGRVDPLTGRRTDLSVARIQGLRISLKATTVGPCGP